MEKWIGKVAVVTGSSSGIGEETCRQLVKKGMIVVGLARREDKLRALQKELNGKFYYVKVDLRSEKNILEAFAWIKNTLKSLDVLINNAGVSKFSNLLGNTEDWKDMYDINVMALNICSREAIKIMKETEIKEGHIININSVAGHYYIPFINEVAVYSSTKFCVTSLTEYMRRLINMEKLPIRVTSISPGLVKTEMSASFIGNELNDNEILKSSDVAESIIYALGVPKRVNVSEIILRPISEDMMCNLTNTN